MSNDGYSADTPVLGHILGADPIPAGDRMLAGEDGVGQAEDLSCTFKRQLNDGCAELHLAHSPLYAGFLGLIDRNTGTTATCPRM
jgi:hypothetical protein